MIQDSEREIISQPSTTADNKIFALLMYGDILIVPVASVEELILSLSKLTTWGIKPKVLLLPPTPMEPSESCQNSPKSLPTLLRGWGVPSLCISPCMLAGLATGKMNLTALKQIIELFKIDDREREQKKLDKQHQDEVIDRLGMVIYLLEQQIALTDGAEERI